MARSLPTIMNSLLTYIIVLLIGVAGGYFYAIAPAGERVESHSEEATMMEATGETKSLSIEIVEKAITSGETTLKVNQGDTVTLMITSDEAEEFHVHGYDASVELTPGETAELSFVAGASGRFPFELEESKTELGALEVQPQ